MELIKNVFSKKAENFNENGRMRRIWFLVLLLFGFILGVCAIFISFLALPALIASAITGIFCIYLARKYRIMNKLAEKYKINDLIKQRLKLDSTVFSRSSSILALIDVICCVALIMWMGLSVGITILAIAPHTALLIVVTARVVQLRQVQTTLRTVGIISTIYATGRNENFMSGGKIMVEKLKSIVKYIFKSNPYTIFCGMGVIIVMMVNGELNNAIANYLLGWLNDQTAINVVFHTLLAIVGVIGLGVGCLESNEDADARKKGKKSRRAVKRCEKQARKLAYEKLAQERSAEEENRKRMELHRLEQLTEQVKRELENEYKK